MVSSIVKAALNHRLLILGSAVVVMIVGTIVAERLPIDVLPDLTRPRVTIITECRGLAPEEVETLVTVPIEREVNGVSGVEAVRSSSDIGLSVVTVEFGWDQEIYRARQLVQERLTIAASKLPRNIEPQLAPVSSLLGQIMIIGMWSEDGKTSSMKLRTQADWIVRQRLQAIRGVAQVIVMGGGRKQFQVLVDPHLLHEFDVELQDVERGLQQGNLNVTGGYLNRGAREWLIRGMGRILTKSDIERIVVKSDGPRPVAVKNIATVVEREAVKRGDASVNGRNAVVLTIQKQPRADTRALTKEIERVLEELQPALDPGVRLKPTYRQREFIDHSVRNVAHAVRDGAILVIVVLFLFLLNLRTTFITLTAIPLSLLTTALVFQAFGLSINIMTLGGLAVALGELVDDAIVDVENIFRRLRENSQRAKPISRLRVVFAASQEVRGAIIISTVLVVLVFVPLFFLSGMEGRLFTPLGLAYVVSIIASTVVSLTVTPVLSFFLLRNAPATRRTGDGFVLAGIKWLARPIIRIATDARALLLMSLLTLISVGFASLVMLRIGKNFLPKFDEGSAQVNLFANPGTSLESSRKLAAIADAEFAKLVADDAHPDRPLIWFTAKTGRAEDDEHVMGVNVSEYTMALNSKCPLSKKEIIKQLELAARKVPGVEIEIEQPVAHLISHMLSGVTAEIAIKLHGDNLSILYRKAAEIKAAITDIGGISPPIVEQQSLIPQLRIRAKRDVLADHGISVAHINAWVKTALNGEVVSLVVDEQRRFDLMVRLEEDARTNLQTLSRMPFDLPDGTRLSLGELAEVFDSGGPNTIKRENARRRIVVRVNTKGRDLESAVRLIQQRIDERVELPAGYYITLGGQFEAQQSATRVILTLSIFSGIAIILVLYATFRSVSLALQVMVAIPVAFVGGVLAMLLTGQVFSVASLVGFISLGGIAARNGILLIQTYLDRIKEHGFTRDAIVQGNLDRLAPVLMTALTTGIALVPLVIGGHLPGKEILFPVATVILGGLVTSTLAEFLLRPGLFWYCTSRGTIEHLSTTEPERLD